MCHLSIKLSDKFDPNQNSNVYFCQNSGKTHFCERNTLKA